MLLFRQIDSYTRHDEGTTWFMKHGSEEVKARWSKFNNCYSTRVTWSEIDENGTEVWKTEEYLKTDGDLGDHEVLFGWNPKDALKK